ncbi:CDP-glycerol--poly(glycerophosphate) glycerophosphotransferase [Dethiobacter alkaliphilus]|uniref:CDP-glycerol:poly(Glycerophosphate) glycerophosphotransferase n=1 Tax=Dethiobacter alkaliphilus AHT 1 TaxID=555088 RepID=C0GGT9_DETAL|nr:CDP-glycerol--poly(glycerophosphate) glycerophosphotransferase [Dethiobacter alkaliphilus]EEG77530.1 CDP-glycerol:poly(glycerophosphate) glycerophosphotransferase [Dethiobacter alkaliphilus AHT 1]
MSKINLQVKSGFFTNAALTVLDTVKFFVKKCLYLFGYLVFIPISYLMPKKRYVVLTSRFGDFDGSLKYFYMYLNGIDEPGVEFVFLTEKRKVYRNLKDNGYNVWYYPSFRTILLMFQTYLLIVDGNEWAKNLKYFIFFKARKVQIWHGTGLKTIGLLKPQIKRLNPIALRLKKEYIYYDLLTLSSQYQVKMRSKAFRYGKLVLNGLPRNDIFFAHQLKDQVPGSDYESLAKFNKLKQSGYYLVTYAPTWRRNEQTLSQLKLQELDQFARLHQFIIILKLHPKHHCVVEPSDYSNIVEYSKTADIYPLLTLTDLLITDYSSIYLDYLLLDRPIIFFPYDRQSYVGGERELLLDYDQITPGPKCYNQKELQEQIHHHLTGAKDQYQAKREEICKMFFHYRDGKSSERLWKAIKENFLN